MDANRSNDLAALMYLFDDEESAAGTSPGAAADSVSCTSEATPLPPQLLAVPKLRDLKNPDMFLKEFPCQLQDELQKESKSLVHSGDTDSSDDEDRRHFEEQNYTESGRHLKKILSAKSKPSEQSSSASSSFTLNLSNSWKTKPSGSSGINDSLQVTKLDRLKQKVESTKKVAAEFYADPISGIRIVNPLVPLMSLQEKMEGRQGVQLSSLQRSIDQGMLSNDWVTVGVLVASSPVKTSQKGTKYVIWKLCDLKGELKTISLFLFGNAYSAFWKTTNGAVIGVLNPSIMDKRDGQKDDLAISIDVSQKLLIIGKSKDFGFCKSKKKDGTNCSAFVNLNTCEHCIYHAQQEYRKCSRRSELQSATSGGLTGLRNKVLGKNEVFYGGQSYAAVPAKANKKQIQKDHARLEKLSGVKKSQGPASTVPASGPQVQSVVAGRMFEQRLAAAKNNDKQLCTRLGISSVSQQNLVAKKSAPKLSALSQGSYLSFGVDQKEKTLSSQGLSKATESQFTLSLKKFDTWEIDTGSVSNNSVAKAKMAAIKYVKNHGPIKKVDPNAVKKEEWIDAKKRKLGLVSCDTPSSKRVITHERCESSAEQDKPDVDLKARFKKMMELKSTHTDLIQVAQQEAQDSYFDNLEKKERLEEKMLQTFKVDCKAVKCLKCKYTAFSKSDLCRKENHPVRVVDAVKRFYQCKDCRSRTTTLELIPTISCKNCGSSRWERAPMIREKTAILQKLSICGNNEKEGGFIQDANLNLLVPE